MYVYIEVSFNYTDYSSMAGAILNMEVVLKGALS